MVHLKTGFSQDLSWRTNMANASGFTGIYWAIPSGGVYQLFLPEDGLMKKLTSSREFGFQWESFGESRRLLNFCDVLAFRYFKGWVFIPTCDVYC